MVSRGRIGVYSMGRRRGAIEEWLKKVMWGGHREEYIIYIKHRGEDGVETLKPIYAGEIADVRGGYIVIGDEVIPFHRVMEIRKKSGEIVYRRGKQGSP